MTCFLRHKKLVWFCACFFRLIVYNITCSYKSAADAIIAQLGWASAWRAGGHRFDPCWSHIKRKARKLNEFARKRWCSGLFSYSETNISCTGCKPENWCRYHVVKCCQERGISTCGDCSDYPCDNMKECFEVTRSFEPACRKVCTDEEYESLKTAFFEKEKNMNTKVEKAGLEGIISGWSFKVS